MGHIKILDILQTPQLKPGQFDFEIMHMERPWNFYITPQDEYYLYSIATSLKLNGNADKKCKMIKAVMEARGFKRLAGGTNREVYRYLEDPSFVAKVAIDRVGLSDNPDEFRNQELLKPYCAKMFQVTPSGVVGFAEKVQPVMSADEFKSIAEYVLEMLYYRILGKYVLEDIGTYYFKNYGFRAGFGPVLLDYPYVYELDGAKLFCQNQYPDGTICGGVIDYDEGFNRLICKNCGKKYEAVQLKAYKEENKLVIKKGGTIPMKVKLKIGDTIIASSENESATIVNTNQPKLKEKSGGLKVHIKRTNEETKQPEVKDTKPEVKTDSSKTPKENDCIGKPGDTLFKQKIKKREKGPKVVMEGIQMVGYSLPPAEHAPATKKSTNTVTGIKGGQVTSYSI